MPDPFIPSPPLVYAGGTLDRLSEQRTESTLAEALADPNARAYAFAGGDALVRGDETCGDPLFSLADM
ncbi:MAG: NADH pyrophosphatase, partial [Pseudomonadota bacterium]